VNAILISSNRPAASLTAATVAVMLLAAPVPAATLTNATQVRALTREEAAKQIPVRLRGVVLDEAGQGEGLVIQDATAGVYLTGPNSTVAKIRRGDLIEVEGASDPGGFAPIVRLQKYRKLGTAPIPEPQHVAFE
jgi:outer membrane receptor protein involved in Fe transport